MSLSCPCCATARCLKCCGAKCALDMLVADAGAMYEAVDSRFVLVCLNVFLRGRIWDIRGLRFSEQRNFMVSLRNKNFHQHNNVDLVPFEQIKAIHSFWLKVPRGGLLSKRWTSLVLCAKECIWNTTIGKPNAFRAVEQLQWKQQVAACRYCRLLSYQPFFWYKLSFC